MTHLPPRLALSALALLLGVLPECGPSADNATNTAAVSPRPVSSVTAPAANPIAHATVVEPEMTVTLTTGRKQSVGTGWARRGVWHTPTGTVRLAHPGTVVGLAEAGDWLLVERAAGEAPDAGLDLMTRDADVVRRARIQGKVAVDPARQIAAWADPRGHIHTLSRDGDVGLAPQPRGTVVTALISNGPTCLEIEGGSCTAVLHRDEHTATYTTTHGFTDIVAEDAAEVSDQSHRYVAFRTLQDGPTSCSRVAPLRRPSRSMWDVCELELGQFSPDGRFLIASGHRVEGQGARFLELRESGSGVPLLRVQAPDGGRLSSFEWADATHIVVIVWDGKHFQVVRVGLDGTATRLSRRANGETSGNPFLLERR